MTSFALLLFFTSLFLSPVLTGSINDPNSTPTVLNGTWHVVSDIGRRDFGWGQHTTCRASSMCKTINNCCDKAAKKIEDNMIFKPGRGTGGVCQHVCGIFVEGPPTCELTGRDMKEGIKYLHSHGCRKCGSTVGKKGCKLKIDYVSHCKDGGLQYLGMIGGPVLGGVLAGGFAGGEG